MSLLERFFGPRSKYDKTLPYSYEARMPVFDDGDECKSYFSDTICGLVEHLHRLGIRPGQVRIFELYLKQEFPIDARHFATAENEWLFKPDICRAFQEHYKGHIQDKTCSFKDRARVGIGP